MLGGHFIVARGSDPTHPQEVAFPGLAFVRDLVAIDSSINEKG